MTFINSTKYPNQLPKKGGLDQNYDRLIKQLRKSPKFHLKVFGKSMLSILIPGDMVYFSKISFRKARVDEIVLAKQGSNVFIHRVIYKGDRFIITKGDNNPNSDGKITARNLLAKAYQIKRAGEVFDINSLYLLQSSFYLNQIMKIKKVLEQKGINYLFLKGLPLHLYFEGSLPRRIYADCDILIDKKDFLKVKRIFTSLGYKQASSALSSAHQKLKDKEPEVSFVKTISGFPVIFDVHLEAVFMMTQLGKLDPLYPQRLLDQYTTHLLENKRLVSIQDETYPILAKEDLIIYLLLHLFHHNFKGAYRYDLIIKILRKQQLDWNKLKDILTTYQLENFVYPVLLLLSKYYQPKLLPQAKKDITKWKINHNFLSQKILKEDIFSDEPRAKSGVKRFLYLFLLSPSKFFRKILIFTNFQVIYSIFWTISAILKAKANKSNFR